MAGGLVGTSLGAPVFCADAIADPLTGLEATWAVTESLARGGGESIHVSMAAVAATYAALPTEASVSAHPAPPPPLRRRLPQAAASSALITRRYDDLVSERRCLSC